MKANEIIDVAPTPSSQPGSEWTHEDQCALDISGMGYAEFVRQRRVVGRLVLCTSVAFLALVVVILLCGCSFLPLMIGG